MDLNYGCHDGVKGTLCGPLCVCVCVCGVGVGWGGGIGGLRERKREAIYW